VSRRLEDLHPVVRTLCLLHQEKAEGYGLKTLLIETYRDEAGQLAQWRKGRDEHGNVIDRAATTTDAPPGASWHGLQLADGRPASFAYHLAVIRTGGLVGLGPDPGAGERMDKAAEAILDALATIGESVGLVAGARWKRRDWMHFEYHPDGATLSQLQAALLAQARIAGPREKVS
jgi:hypothetical protein